MRFPPSLLDDIRARIPLSEVVGRRVTWDKRKSNPGRGDYWACCPFHGEKTPSFHADNRKGRYHCFGCGVSGDHFTFLVEQEGLTFPEAVTQLAADAGVPLPERDAGSERREAERASLHEIMEKAAQFFEAALQAPEGAKARAYLRERGLGADVQKRFRLGYAPASRNALKEHLANAGIPQEQMIEAGLLIAGEEIPVSYDRFRDRIIFPIGDFRGKVIAFGGRALAADAQAKYLNSPETPLFHKGSVLYNGQAARGGSRKGTLIAVEGYIDVIACVAAGFEATVAPLGTALTEDQMRLLWQMADEPVLCFDGDAAGVKAAYRAIDTALPLLAPGKSLRFALLPEGSDPDDFIRAEGPEAFRKSLEAARPLVDMLWQREAGAQDLSTPERRAGLEQTLRQSVATIADPSVRKHYEQAVRDRVAAAFGPVRRPRPDRRDFQRQGSRERWTPRQEVPRGPSPSLLANALVRDRRSPAPTLSDAVLLGALICNPEIAAERLEHLAGVTFRTADLGTLADSLGEALSADPDIGRDALLARLQVSGAAKSLESVLEKLRSAGYSELIEGDPERAAIIWDDAAHLRLRATALSIERQAAALALGRDASEFHLIRLRDIQEQDQRSLRAEGGEAEDAVIVHPFKGQVPGGR